MPDPPPAGSGRLTQTYLAIPSSQDHFDVSLPEPLTSFVGRKREIAAVSALVRREGVRLVTLTGPGGVGKTRLALRVVEELHGDCTHGTAFVDLAPIAVPDLVAPTIAAALGLRESGARDVAERLLDALRDRPLLLVLDNFEQVVEAASLVVRVLLGCPRVKILVTSRIALRLSGERVITVEPLTLPDHDERQGLRELLASEAVALFVGRAQDVRPDFLVSDSNAPVVVEICRRVDGLPLAIELAAARIAHLPLPALLARLEKRLPFLTGGPRDVPKRQRTLRETIAWSHDLLPPEERVLFRRLAVFLGGARLDAVAAVANAGGDLRIDVFDGVTSLVGSSLLRQVEDADDEPRYVFLETIREYGLERVADSGEEEGVRRDHAAFFLAFAESDCSGPGWPGTPARVAALEREQTNLRAALAWAIRRGETETALRLVAALGGFWRVRARLREGRAWSERALALAGETESPLRVRVDVMLGWLVFSQGDEVAAGEIAERALAAARRLGDIGGTARALGLLGCLALEQGDPDRAEALLAEAEALSRQANDRFATAAMLYLQGVTIAFGQGSPARATACYEESLILWREVGDMWGQAVVLSNLAWLVRRRGNARRAAELEREALTIQWA
ncbi:MAG: tetratricopeptide repeat protein, partial [Chloroflexia bacterium]|nr:tetratricopeptide repeat protein [Chloroflexia bacterium]